MVLPMRHTVTLATLPLNTGKREGIRELARTYSGAKDHFLTALAPTTMWRFLFNKRGFRDWAKQNDLYPDGVSVHLLDQAAFDAVDTWVRHIESVIATSNLKVRIYKRFTDEDTRHYAYSVLTNYADIGAVLGSRVPKRPKIQVSEAKRSEVCRFLHRQLRDAFARSKNPRAHRARSISLDTTTYRTFTVERPGGNPTRCQYVSMIGSAPNQRIALPLAGISGVTGNIQIVLDEGSPRAFVHVTYETAQLRKATGPEKAIDWGITEVATDQLGQTYGDGYGKALEKISEKNKVKGQRRGKLHSLAKAQAGSKRARRIARHNLGSKKQTRKRDAHRATLRTITGAGVKEIVYGEGNRTRAKGRVVQSPSQRPRLILHEDLSHLRGKAKSKKLSRLCSAWMRSELEVRMVVHAYRGCSPTKAVNAAYTSQTCPEPDCGYVHRNNRSGDRFHCRNPHWDCEYQGGADQVAAVNLLARASDQQITLYTPYTKVKRVLDERFQRRLESRTGDTGVSTETTSDGGHARVVEGDATAHGRTPGPRRVRPAVGGTGNPGPVHESGPHGWDRGDSSGLESEKKRRT